MLGTEVVRQAEVVRYRSVRRAPRVRRLWSVVHPCGGDAPVRRKREAICDVVVHPDSCHDESETKSARGDDSRHAIPGSGWQYRSLVD